MVVDYVADVPYQVDWVPQGRRDEFLGHGQGVDVHHDGLQTEKLLRGYVSGRMVKVLDVLCHVLRTPEQSKSQRVWSLESQIFENFLNTVFNRFSRKTRFNRQFKKIAATNLWFFSPAEARFSRNIRFSRKFCGDQFFY